jgi:hypothetical protein
MKKALFIIHYSLFISVALLSLCSCYNRGQQTPDAWNLTEQQLDSISFYTTHHYTQNFNFLVRADSLPIIPQLPAEAISDMPVDTLMLYKGEQLVVADIMTVPADSLDSIWVKVARDQLTFGWIHERELLNAVSPDDTISQFIDFFSDAHLLIFLAFVVIVMAAYIYVKLMRRQAKIVHFNDIASFYPTLLCLLVASSATLYSSIQLFDPEMWRHFYYHPTLNPYAVPFWLCVFLCSLWAAVLVAVATLDDVRRRQPFGEAILYLLGLVATCAVVYVVFSVLTMYYVGYLLLPVYIVWALRCYRRQPRSHYRCGHCGAELQEKGHCPHCGALNV